MCAVSVVLDYWSQRPIDIWTRPTFDQFKDIIGRLDHLDGELSQPECEDPSKAEWMKRVEDRLNALEYIEKGES